MGVKTAHFHNGPVSKWHSSKTAPEPKRLISKTVHFYGAIWKYLDFFTVILITK